MIGGVAIVLVLLLVVGLVGFWAVNQKTAMSKQVATAESLITAGLSMQRDILDAMNAVNLETITKEQKWADEVQRIATDIQEKHQKDFDLIEQAKIDPAERTKIANQYRTLLDKVRDFAATDAKAWNTEVKRKQAAVERFDLAERALEHIDELWNFINQTARERALTQDGASYYVAAQVERSHQTGVISDSIRDIRRLCYQYTAATDAKEKAGYRNEITQFYNDGITQNIDELTQQLELRESQELLKKVQTETKKWYETVKHVMDLEEEYAGFDNQTTQIADDLVNGIANLLPTFEGLAEKAADEDATFNRFIQLTITIVSLIAITLGIVISLVIAQNITVGIKHASMAMGIIADEGNVSIVIPEADLNRGDEVGDMAKAFKNIVQQFQNVEQLANNLANGNYDTETKVRGDMDTMNINLNKMLDQVNRVLAEIDEGVKQVATGAGEVSSASQALSNGAQESAASLEQITASMSEISSQTKTNAESAGQARDLAHQASQAAGEGQTAMKNMTEAMERITANSTEIQRVIKVIDDIAFQTNLLALNAAVEAARAGQHGKGFAVVAEEVRNLAARSAKAAKETSELITKSGHEIAKGGEVTHHTAEVLNTIVEQVKQTTELVAGIAVASNEQAQGVNQVTIGVQQIDSVTQQNTAAAEESASAASEMSSMAATLQKQVALFKLRGQSKKSSSSSPAPAQHAPAQHAPVQHTPIAAAGAKKPITAPKPLAGAKKPAAAAPHTPSHTPAPVAHHSPSPAEPVLSDAQWGGGKTADIHIDLDDKNFGKY